MEFSISEDSLSIRSEANEDHHLGGSEQEDAPLTAERGLSSFADWRRQEQEMEDTSDLGDTPMSAYQTQIFSTPNPQADDTYNPTAKYQSSSFEFGAFIKETKESSSQDGPFVSLKNVSFSVQEEMNIEKNPFARKELVEKTLLSDISFFMAPGKMTLLLGPPGCGKTTLIKFLAQRLPPGYSHGEFLISGNPPNLQTHQRDTGYITQEDRHLAPLTVYETLMFSANCQMSQNCSEELKVQRVQKTMELLGISHRADVVAGDALLRGISGGEKRRLSIGIEIVKAPKMILLDEPTTGLDSQVSFQVIRRLKKLGQLGQVPVLAALLQPSPELFGLFDNVLILGEGEVAYFGPTSSALAYFEEIGFTCPLTENPADFLQNVLQKPENYHRERGADSQFPVIRTPQDFAREYKSSVHYEAVQEVLGKEDPEKNITAVTNYQDLARYPTSKFYQFKLCLERDVKLVTRDLTILRARIMKSIIFSLILGSLFFQLEDYQDGLQHRVGVVFFLLLTANMAGLVTVPGLIKRRDTFLLQRDGMYYHTFPYMVSMIVADLPVTILETVFSVSIVWWISSIDSNVASFLYGILTTLWLEFFSLALCRFISSVSPDFESANSITPAVLALTILFCGFMITLENIPYYWRPLYYLSAIGYAFQGVMISVFVDTTWKCTDDQLVPSSESPLFNVSYPQGFQGNQVCPITEGEDYLEALDMSTDPTMKWILWIPLWFLIIVFNILNFWGMKTFSYDKKRRAVSSDADETTIHIASETQSSNSLAFLPVGLYFQEISYSVPLKDGKETKELQLLNNVSGFAEPGSLVALMGSSGAGKSTLLDVLADRKTYGTISGKITINGRERGRIFKQIMGYVEQQDLHIESQNVREAIEFSATLRLPSDSYSVDQKLNFAQSVLEILDLEGLQHRELKTLSGEQKKRVTIGVEMAANPSILFLDEPTSGLDSNGADRVMSAVSRISASGRTVICTIHQPSRKLFELFSHLLLLKKGGEVAYFGRVGTGADHLKNYFETFGFSCAPQKNPADFILEISGNNSIQSSTFYSGSELYKQNIEYLNQKIDSTEAELPPLRGRYVTSFGEQLKENIIRRYRTWKRSPDVLTTQVITSIGVAFILGTLFWQLDNDQDGYSNRVSVLFFVFIFINMNALITIPSMMSCRPAFYREHSSATYQSPTFLLGQDLVNLPVNIFMLLIFVIPTYLMAGLNSDPVRFLSFLLICIIFSMGANFICQFFASVTADAAVANLMGSALMSLSGLFCGFLLPIGDFPVWWKWIYYVLPASYALDAIVSNELDGETFYCTDDQLVLVPIEGTNETKPICPITTGSAAAELYDYSYDHLSRSLTFLACVIGFTQIITHLGFRYARMIKR